MAKKKQITASPSKKITFMSYGDMRERSVAPYVPKEDLATIPWVYHDTDNLYPENLRKLVDNCGPLERSITQLSEFIAGNGVIFYDQKGNEIEAAQGVFQEWMRESSEEQFLAQTAYDLSHGLGLTWAVRRAAGGAIARLDHRSRFGFRAGKTVNGVIPQMYWSNDWKEAMWNTSDPMFRPTAIPTMDWSGKKLEEEAIVFERQYHPIEPVYGRIFWLGCRRAAEVWVKVDNYNKTQLDTGFTPAVLLATHKEGTDAELDKHDERVEMAYTGSMGRGLFHVTLGPNEQEPFLKELKRGNHAGELDEMRNGAAEVIFETFGIPSLLMRDRAEGLTSQERAIAIRLQQLQRTTVATLQKLPGRALTRLMNMAGIPVWETKFKALEVFDPVQSEAIIKATQTVNEARDMRGDEPLADAKIGDMLICQAEKLPSDPQEARDIAMMKAKQPVLSQDPNQQ